MTEKPEPLTKEKIAMLVWQVGVTDDDLKSAVNYLIQEIEKDSFKKRVIERLKNETDKSIYEPVLFFNEAFDEAFDIIIDECKDLIKQAFSGVLDND